MYVNKLTGLHDVWLDPNYNVEYENYEDEAILLEKNLKQNESIFQSFSSTILPVPVLKVKHLPSFGITTYLTITDPNELLIIQNLENRLIVTIPQEVHDLRSTRFYMILRGIT